MARVKNGGFVLVEAIVVISFILGIITFLFMNILPIIGEYEKVDQYDQIASKYDIHMIRKMLLKDDDCKLQNLLTFDDSDTYYIFEGTEICNYLENNNYCTKLLSKDYLDVKNIIVARYNVTGLKSLSGKFNRNLAEYITLMPKYDKLETIISSEYTQYSRRLIVEFNDGSVTNIELLKLDNASCITGC